MKMRCIDNNSDFYSDLTVGKIYETYEYEGSPNLVWVMDNKGRAAYFKRRFEPVEEGPIRTTTKTVTEIVPGWYEDGKMNVDTFSFPYKDKIRLSLSSSYYDEAQVRCIADNLIKIADAMKEIKSQSS